MDLYSLGRREVELLRALAVTEDRAAETFAGLASTGMPSERLRREELAHQARIGAAAARRLARQIEAKLGEL
jgi:hypothetical protein